LFFSIDNFSEDKRLLQEFTKSTDVIDWQHPAVLDLARCLAVPGNLTSTARRCFEFVRDQITHSRDFQQGPATCRASEALIHGTGYCYAKSHLLAGLLRANNIPAGFCYQRLSINDSGPPFSLHGYNAVYLPEHGWYRIDARGNKSGVNAEFDPPTEKLAFKLQCQDEYDFQNIFAKPLDCVVQVLQGSDSWEDILDKLPDIQPDQFQAVGLTVRRAGISQAMRSSRSTVSFANYGNSDDAVREAADSGLLFLDRDPGVGDVRAGDVVTCH
jgi:hypothetical protein